MRTMLCLSLLGEHFEGTSEVDAKIRTARPGAKLEARSEGTNAILLVKTQERGCLHLRSLCIKS
jgi:hypothetical protein